MLLNNGIPPLVRGIDSQSPLVSNIRVLNKSGFNPMKKMSHN